MSTRPALDVDYRAQFFHSCGALVQSGFLVGSQFDLDDLLDSLGAQLHRHAHVQTSADPLTGTPFLCWHLRLLGAKIGRRVYVETTDFTEFDLVRIGDQAELNADCTIQTHLFEDRVMKMSNIQIGPRAHVGAGSLVLYDTVLEEGASLGGLSLLMKGETLAAGSRWEGIPAQRAE